MLAQIELAQATQIDVLVGSVANGLNSSTHGADSAPNRVLLWVASRSTVPLSFSPPPSQRFLRSLPRRASTILRNMPSILGSLQETVRAICAVLDRVEAVTEPLSRRLADHPHPAAFGHDVHICFRYP